MYNLIMYTTQETLESLQYYGESVDSLQFLTMYYFP